MKKSVMIGVIGVGYWGPNLVRNFSELDESEVVWACDKREPRLRYITQQWTALKATKDYNDILKDNSIDAVVVATPLETHFRIAKDVLAAGKHVFIEKPMTYSAEQAIKLVHLADKKKLKIGTGHIFVYHPGVVKIKEILYQKQIGSPCYMYSTRMNPAPSHGNVDVIWDLVVHDVSIALLLWKQIPERVRAFGRAFNHGGRIDVATIEAYFPDGTLGFHHVGWLTSAKERSFFIGGNNGSIRFDDTIEEKVKIIGPPVDTRCDKAAQSGRIFYSTGKTENVRLSDDEPLKKECNDFVDAIIHQKEMISDGLFGHSVVKVLEAASLSVRNEGKNIRMNERRG